MAKRAALGRGLAALLGEGTDGEGAALIDDAVVLGGRGVIDLPVGSIKRNPRQPRRVMDQEALEELARSIAAVGVVQPIIVRQTAEGYELIAGERRWLAAQKAGFTVVPAILRGASDTESLEIALIENVVRQQLNPVDEAYALKILLEDLGVTQENLAARVGKSRSAIANKVRLLDLPLGIQELMSAGSLSEGHGRALLGVGERGKQLRLARRASERGLSVRQVEEEVRRLNDVSATKAAAPAPALESELADQVRDRFFSSLGVVPRLRLQGKGGRVEIPFSDADDLRRLMERLGS
jgi:ParB family transcriptional regulator, chromosome partitioning protein